MPWNEVSIVSQRDEFVRLALHPGANIRELCRRYQVAPATAYKWIRRYRVAGPEGLVDRSKRPHHSPGRMAPSLEAAICALREKHPDWGARKMKTVLARSGPGPWPSVSTVHAVLKRNNLLESACHAPGQTWRRFEASAPNALWQMDFKGYFPTDAGPCHPLTVLDDHSRFNIAVEACTNEQRDTVQARLQRIFERWGLPRALLADNGAPWGSAHGPVPTRLAVWLMRLNIKVYHSRPRHPQTLGKLERFHRTLNVEVIQQRPFRDLAEAQQHFDRFRERYNTYRPHQALDMAVPAQRYRMSTRPMPSTLPPIEYAPEDAVRKVQSKGEIHFKGFVLRVGKAFHGYPVALRPTTCDGCYDVYFCQNQIAHVDLTQQEKP
jgi:transposase InsO family protein